MLQLIVELGLFVIFFQYENFLEWNGGSLTPIGRFISYFKERKIFYKGYLYHLVRIKDSSSQIPTLESVPVVNEFLIVFLEDLL